MRGAVPSLGREDPPEEGRAAHCSILAWRIPWTLEPGGCVHGVAKGRALTAHTQAGRVCGEDQEDQQSGFLLSSAKFQRVELLLRLGSG